MTAEKRQDADVILMKLSEYFMPKQNKIYERYVFNSHSQKADESFDKFLTALRKLAAICEFDTFEDEMLRDHIVTGSWDHGLRERLLRELIYVSNLVLFPSLAKRRNVVHARTHEEIHVPRVRAIFVVTHMQPETPACLLQNVRKMQQEKTASQSLSVHF